MHPAIPKVIHHFWTSDHSAGPPDDIKRNLDAWRETHPDYEFRLWTPESLHDVLDDVTGTNVLDVAGNCRFAAMQSDVIRLGLVYELGGVWSDLKNLPLEPFLDGFTEDGETFFTEHPPTEKRPEPRDYLCNQLFGARAQDPLIFDCLSEAIDAINKRTQGSVYAVTGGAMIMKVLARAKDRGLPHRLRTLRYQETWGVRMKRTSASYNNGGMHWSERQKRESLYKD